MNKKEFIAKWSELSGVSNNKLEELLKSFVCTVGDALVSGEKITLPSFGTFSLKERPERLARNPLTGESVKVAAKNVLKFKVGKQLEEKLNQGSGAGSLSDKDKLKVDKKTIKSLKNK